MRVICNGSPECENLHCLHRAPHEPSLVDSIICREFGPCSVLGVRVRCIPVDEIVEKKKKKKKKKKKEEEEEESK